MAKAMAMGRDAQQAAGGEGRQPWDQQPGEPDRWFGRFQVFLQLGPTRTLGATYRTVRKLPPSSRQAAPSNWTEHAPRWRWRQRAAAWDVWQRSLLALSERNLRLGLRERRVDVMEETLETIRTALATANIAGADEAMAREWLPQLRVFLRDMLVAERQEFERLDFDGDDPAGATITADDLRAAQRQMEAQAAAAEAQGDDGEIDWEPEPLFPARLSPTPRTCANPFLVCTGRTDGLSLDLARLRGVRAETGLRFQRLIEPTRRAFAETLRRQRGLGYPIAYVHFALRATSEGFAFADGPVDGDWLNERLEGVRIVLLACGGGDAGERLRAVPYVISVREGVTDEDAAVLAEQFWRGIGRGQEADDALDQALAHCPPAVSEAVVRHW